ncbi:hypothetical protein DFJ77DRAFT_433991 [Powellomyces hirtus]|nr:hypothetical protein DFJ77DRAFT_433991 [Powellomyces hirtus]
MQTVASLVANSSLLAPLEYDKHLTSTTTTTPRYPRTDLNTLASWQTFSADVATAKETWGVAQVPATAALGPFDPEPVTGEECVRLAIRTTVHKSLLKCLAPLYDSPAFAIIGGNKHAIGLPDYVYRSGPSTKPKLVIEVKTDWAFPQTAPILTEWPSVRNNPRAKLTRVVHQLYGYMTFNHLRYGILTNYVQTWFFRRVDAGGGRLEVTDAFPYTNTKALLEAYLTVVVLAEHNWFYASPTSSSAPTRRTTIPPIPSASSDPYTLQNVDVRAIHFSRGVDRSRVGVIVRGTYFGAPVVMKIVDASKQQEAAEELEWEVSVYEALASLSGSVIPRLIAYVEVWDMLQILVLEDCGENLGTYETNGGVLSTLRAMCNDCLAQVNSLGFAHNDVKRENFVIANGVVRLIDLGQATNGKRVRALSKDAYCTHMMFI